RKALAALWLIADGTGLDALIEAARPYGDEAVEALDEALRTDRPVPEAEKAKPKPSTPKPPKLPWLDVNALPHPVLRDSGKPLPTSATANLISLLALADGRLSPELREIFDRCDRASLTALSWAIFEAWRAAREPSRNNWVLYQLGWLGNDETVRQLTPIIRVWPGRSGHHKAVLGLGVLAEIGTDVALMHLNGIAQKVKFTGLKEAAQRTLAEVAKERGLSTEQLADRLVP
ncbi:hypothetical protein ACFQ07_13985, partial [Actinomadura adrarensis]